MLLWFALHVHPMLACAGTSDELRGDWPAVASAVVSGRCELQIDLSR
jgi:hypothetical protein